MCVYNYISYIWLLRKSVLYIYICIWGRWSPLESLEDDQPDSFLERLRALIPVRFSSQETKTLQNPGRPKRTRHTTIVEVVWIFPKHKNCTPLLSQTKINKHLTLGDEFDSIHHQKSTQFHASFWFGVFGGNLSDRESRTACFWNLVLDCQNRMSTEHFLK